ncbi:conserved hypothetical protein [Pseudomonas veronii]|uniref:hypothetical protein n=1 Tax=Pseudomonas veronii TaxID=76761 RepID=UPI001765BFB1|nr:hypothetical protein [Pseudomonas veronii]CAD0266049.1 conserved hypothetical protein [Pseudomonas veronii]
MKELEVQGSIFLVMATGIKNGQRPVPLLAFPGRTQAEEWQAELIGYHISSPDMPAGDDAALWKEYDAQLKAWRDAHPAGVAVSDYQHFGVYEVPLGM